ncbi:MAG: L-threonylcarbamoyladenylate synthase [Oscillospiraceae bacterium]|nr:L-threonylcarbamoyladenylate synthase [Oscillospiraceae bacterium]
METIILNANDPESISRCADVIRSGGLVAIPTETVYGLGANALDENAVAGIFATKGRQPDNPLIVHVASVDDVKPLVSFIPEVFETLANKFWPGPLTLIMKKSDLVPSNVTAGGHTVAIRIPEHSAALSLIRASGCPIAAPSANPSGQPSPTKAIHVKSDLDGVIPYILDGGDCRVGLESTVLDISEDVPRILRPGGVTSDELAALLGAIEIDGTLSTDAPRSPGMKYRHYAPNAPVTVVLGAPDTTADYIRENMCADFAALMFDDYAFNHPNVVTYGDSTDYVAQAAHLFDALRKLDDMNSTAIFAQAPHENGLGRAVANRIKKAAGNNIVDLGKK